MASKAVEGSEKFSTGWLEADAPHNDDIVLVSGHTWSSVYLHVQAKTIYKYVVNAKQWYRFTVVPRGAKRELIY